MPDKSSGSSWEVTECISSLEKVPTIYLYYLSSQAIWDRPVSCAKNGKKLIMHQVSMFICLSTLLLYVSSCLCLCPSLLGVLQGWCQGSESSGNPCNYVIAWTGWMDLRATWSCIVVRIMKLGRMLYAHTSIWEGEEEFSVVTAVLSPQAFP